MVFSYSAPNGSMPGGVGPSQPSSPNRQASGLGNCVYNGPPLVGIPFPPIPSYDGHCPPGYAFQSYSAPSIPNPLQSAQDAAGQLRDAAGSIKDAAGLAGKIWAQLTSKDFWKGAGLLAAGSIAVLVGVILWTGRSGQTVQLAREAAKSGEETA